jgi:hypothetical protein
MTTLGAEDVHVFSPLVVAKVDAVLEHHRILIEEGRDSVRIHSLKVIYFNLVVGVGYIQGFRLSLVCDELVVKEL